MPEVGGHSVILDGEGKPICVIRTTRVDTQPFGEVDEEFAWVEGEGDRSFAYWREAHIRFFAGEGTPIEDDDLVVLERFEVVWPVPDGLSRWPSTLVPAAARPRPGSWTPPR